MRVRSCSCVQSPVLSTAGVTVSAALLSALQFSGYLSRAFSAPPFITAVLSFLFFSSLPLCLVCKLSPLTYPFSHPLSLLPFYGPRFVSPQAAVQHSNLIILFLFLHSSLPSYPLRSSPLLSSPLLSSPLVSSSGLFSRCRPGRVVPPPAGGRPTSKAGRLPFPGTGDGRSRPTHGPASPHAPRPTPGRHRRLFRECLMKN